MKVPVLIEPVAGDGFRAQGLEPFGLSAEGATEDQALQNLRQLLENRFAAGARIVSLEVATSGDPWMAMAGMFKDDPYFDEWQQAIAAYRRQIDEQQESP